MNHNAAGNGDLVAEESEEESGEFEEDPEILQLQIHAQREADIREVQRRRRRAAVEAEMLVISAEFKDEFWPYLVDQLIEPPHMLKLLPEHENLLKMKDVNDPLIAAQKIAVMSHLKFIDEATLAAKQTYRNLVLGHMDLSQKFKYIFTVDDHAVLKRPRKCILYKEEFLDQEPMPAFRFYSAAVTRSGDQKYLEVASAETGVSLSSGDRVTLIFPPPPFLFEAHQDVVKCLQFDEEIRQKIFPSPSGLQMFQQRTPMRLESTNLNVAQRSVLDGILNNDPRTVNLCQGPPGTGKTATVVETIKKKLELERGLRIRSHILVVAHSNAAVDNATLGLLRDDGVPNHEIRRIYAHSRPKKLIPYEIKDADITFKDGVKGFYIPTNKATFSGHHITLCTIYIASRLKFLGKKFFSCIFVDEAAQCLEMDSAIPLALFAGPNTSFSLFGDPNQLRPFFRDAILCQQQFDTVTTTMERLQKLVNLQNAPIPNYLLKINYRSRSPIVEPFSTLFYDSQVVSQFVRNEASGRADSFIAQIGGITRFHVCDGEEEGVILKEKLTFQNLKEVKVVEHYMQMLIKSGIEQRDIGIVSPYRGQLAAMMDRLQDSYPNTWMASVDRFQGNERSVIIVSTVRTRTVGFLDDFRRLNVAISRPRDILIVIGSLELLIGDENWNAYARMLLRMNAIYDPRMLVERGQELSEDGRQYWYQRLHPTHFLNAANEKQLNASDEEKEWNKENREN